MPLFSRSPKADGETGLPTIPGGEQAESSPRHTIGELLRQTRQSYGGDIDKIGSTLRIRPAYLTAIEENQYDRLPGPVYAQGFVRAYAVHLGLDGDEAIRRFKNEVAGFEVSRDLSFPMPLVERSIPGGTMVLTAIILAICGYGLWYYVSTGDRAHPERVSAVPPDLVAASHPPAPPAPAAPNGSGSGADAPAPATGVSQDTAAATPSTSATLPATQAPPAAVPSGSAPAAVANANASPAASGAPAKAAPPPTTVASAAPPPATAPTPPASSTATPAAAPATDAASAATPQGKVYGAPANVPARIVVHAVKDSWVQVNSGNEVLTERILHPGDVVRVPDQPGLTLKTGNGAGIALEIDGKLGKPLSGTVRTIALDANQLASGGHTPQAN